MSIFSTILQKLGLQKPAAPAAPAAPAPVANRPGPAYTPNAPVMAPGSGTGTTTIGAKPGAMAMVDVVSKLNGLAKANPEQLDWKVSIVDLLKLLGMDASAGAISALAVELGCPATEMGDSYKRNVWTHKALLQKIADNGGNIPANLLH